MWVGLDSQQEELRRKLHETIQRAGRVVEQRHTFNTAIAANMELLNDLDAPFRGRQGGAGPGARMPGGDAPHACAGHPAPDSCAVA